MGTPHRDVAGHTLWNPCKKKGASIMVVAGLASTSLQTAATSLRHCVELFEVVEHSKIDTTIEDLEGANEGVPALSSHSMADSRDKLHLTRHHLIHAKNFTIR